MKARDIKRKTERAPLSRAHKREREESEDIFLRDGNFFVSIASRSLYHPFLGTTVIDIVKLLDP